MLLSEAYSPGFGVFGHIPNLFTRSIAFDPAADDLDWPNELRVFKLDILGNPALTMSSMPFRIIGRVARHVSARQDRRNMPGT